MANNFAVGILQGLGLGLKLDFEEKQKEREQKFKLEQYDKQFESSARTYDLQKTYDRLSQEVKDTSVPWETHVKNTATTAAEKLGLKGGDRVRYINEYTASVGSDSIRKDQFQARSKKAREEARAAAKKFNVPGLATGLDTQQGSGLPSLDFTPSPTVESVTVGGQRIQETRDPVTNEVLSTQVTFEGDEGDSVSPDAKESIVRFTALLEETEAALEKDPDNEDLLRRKEGFQVGLDNAKTKLGRTEQDIQVLPATKRDRQMDEISATLSNATIAQQNLDRFTEVSSAASRGVPGAVQSLKGVAVETIKGMSELFGFTTPDTVKAQLARAGLDEKTVEEIDSDFLRGMSAGARMNLIYSVAQTFKTAGRDQISTFDVKNAMELVGAGAGGFTVGKALELKRSLTRIQVQSYARGYQLEGITTREKGQFGRGLMTTLAKQKPKVFADRQWAVDREGVVWIQVDERQASILGLKEGDNAVTLEEMIAKTAGN